MNYQKLILVGKSTGDAQSRKSKKGDVTYTKFGLAVSGGKDHSTFFPVTVFGKLAEMYSDNRRYFPPRLFHQLLPK